VSSNKPYAGLTEGSPLHLIWCVPASQFADWKYQQVFKKDKTTVKDAELHKCIKQYVLCGENTYTEGNDSSPQLKEK